MGCYMIDASELGILLNTLKDLLSINIEGKVICPSCKREERNLMIKHKDNCDIKYSIKIIEDIFNVEED